MNENKHKFFDLDNLIDKNTGEPAEDALMFGFYVLACCFDITFIYLLTI